jgi:hypothetical protein
VANIDRLLHFAGQIESISIVHWESMAKYWKDDAGSSEIDESDTMDGERALFQQQIEP